MRVLPLFLFCMMASSANGITDPFNEVNEVNEVFERIKPTDNYKPKGDKVKVLRQAKTDNYVPKPNPKTKILRGSKPSDNYKPPGKKEITN